MSYAASTAVPIERTRAAIEELVREKGATQFMSAFDHAQGKAIIGWTMESRMVRLQVPLPRPDEKRFMHRRTRHGYAWRELPKERQRALWEQACRARWRAILLIMVAKFEAVEAGISDFEREFLADTVMADGSTVGAWLRPQLASMYANGRMPALLPGIGETTR
jgi:hypothetical protein